MSNTDVDEKRAAIRRGLELLADHVFRFQVGQGFWPEQTNVEQIDFGAFFAELHTKVASAYAESKVNPATIVWVDPETGEEVPPGGGIPSGMPASLAEIMFDLLGLFRAVGCDPGALLSGIYHGMVDGADVESVLSEAGETKTEAEAEGK